MILAVAALVAILILAWKHSETFRDIVKGALEAVAGAFNWLKNSAGPLLAGSSTASRPWSVS